MRVSNNTLPIKDISSLLTDVQQNIIYREYKKEGDIFIANNDFYVSNINEHKKEEGDILFFVTSHKECIDIVAKLSESINDSFIMSLYSGCFNKIPELKQYVDDKLKYKEINPNYNIRIFNLFINFLK